MSRSATNPRQKTRQIATMLAVGLALTAAGGQAASAADGGGSAGDAGATLRELAERAGILIGSGAVKGSESTADGRPPNYLAEPRFGEVLAEQFNSLSPENELKWAFVEPEEGVFDFAGLDRLVAFADANDMQVKGHGLISGCCNPDYLLAKTDPAEFRAAMVSHFETIMQRYDGKMDRWDVVSEALTTFGGAGLAHNDFYNVLGPDYVAEAFRIAHAADPDAKLFINENLVEFYPEKRAELYDLVSGLVDDGVPIDGVALQMHETFVGPTPGVITEMVNSYKALGLEVSIAELDVHTYDPVSQAQIYHDVVAEALAAGVTDISFWGFTDKHLWTWLPGAKPLLFDEEYNPKPAYFSTRDALASFVHNPSAPGAGALSNTSGWAYGLHDGNYKVVMNLWHGTPGSYYRLYENEILVDARALDATTAAPQSVETAFTGRPNGTYVYRAELVNSQGVTATTTTTVRVTDAAPAKPVVSHDNWDEDGSFTVTANLWWGTNATGYSILLDGAIVAEGALTASTPNAQVAQATLTGVSAGTHTVTAVFVNGNGSTQSAPVQVTVR